MSQSATTMDLYDIALLLNYERATTETRFRGSKLREIARDRENFKTVLCLFDDWHKHEGPRAGFVFDKPQQPPDDLEPDLPSNMLPPNSPLISKLSDKELETIFYQVRAHDGCFVCIGLLQFFLDLFPNEGTISLRIRTPDGEEYHCPASERLILEMPIILPKQITLAMVLPENMSYSTGGEKSMQHAVWAFSDEVNGNIKTILDMASIQFGDEGRGLKGKGLFALESFEAWRARMGVVGQGVDDKQAKISHGIRGTPREAWLREVARRAKWRWERRDTEPWCGHCGGPVEAKMRCSKCKAAHYCSSEHQKLAWPFHKRFCR